MSTRSQVFLPGQVLAACFVSALISGVTADDKPAANSDQSARTGESDYRRPILAALSWQHAFRAKTGEVQPAWRPDGERLDAEEASWLHKEVRRFDGQPFVPLLQRPLILIFRVDERARSPQQLNVAVIVDGKRFEQSAHGETGRNFLSKTAITAPTAQLPEWPAEVDVEVRVPVAEPEVIKRIEALPAEPIELDRGVKWYVDPAGGAEFRSRGLGEQLPGPAFIFQVDRAQSDPLVEVTYEFRLKDKNFQMRNFSLRQPNGLTTDVKQIVSHDPSIMWVEFYRQQYRTERYEKVRLRKDLMVD